MSSKVIRIDNELIEKVKKYSDQHKYIFGLGLTETCIIESALEIGLAELLKRIEKENKQK